LFDVDPEAARRYVVAQYVKAGCTYSGAARLLGLHEKYLHELVTRKGLRAELARQKAIVTAMLAPPRDT
jgi:hypothetical protein